MSGITEPTLHLNFCWKNLIAKKIHEIYEPEDGMYVINGNYEHGNFGNNHTFNSNSEFVFDTMKKYIQKLEEKIVGLKDTITALRK